MKRPSWISKTVSGAMATVVVSSVVLPMRSARAEWGPFESGALTVNEILADSSTDRLRVKSARVIIDNDAAFASKIEAIRGARSSIRMVYYIYSDDYSSSVLSQELIAAARRGVKVSLLLDYHTNYKHLDLLSMMMREGKGNIEVRLFNRPTREMMKDVLFITSSCSPQAAQGGMTDCSKEKTAKLENFLAREKTDKNISNLGTTFSGLFLSGVYSKSPSLLKTAVLEGGNIDLEEFKQGAGETSPEELEQLKDFGRILFDAKFRGSLAAKIKLGLAFSMYSAQLEPLYRTLSSLLPVDRDRNEAAIKDWQHVTDFTHHKLLAVDDGIVQLGGRNIEDSYHMKPNPLAKKYIFMDTDMLVEFERPDRSVAKTFDKLFNFRDMVATLAEVRRHAPNDMAKNPEALEKALKSCAEVKKTNFDQYDSCVGNRFDSMSKSTISDRMDEEAEKMRKNAEIFRTSYKPAQNQTWKDGSTFDDELSRSDVSRMLLTYIENVHFDKNADSAALKRIYGVSNGRESRSGKHIHSLMVQSLRNVCKVSAEKKEKSRVILHQGYVLFPSNLMMAFASMFNGEWDCRNVDIVVLTNSVETTDLNVINFFARHQLKPLLDFARVSASPKKARIRVLEHLKPAQGSNLSLHTKINIIGEDVILGSANADVRSYYMDTNNGFFFRGATDFTTDYGKMIAKLVSDKTRVRDLTAELVSKSHEQLIGEDLAVVKALIAKFDKKGRVTPERFGQIERVVRQLQGWVYKSNVGFMDVKKVTAPYWRDEADKARVQGEEQKRIGELFNELMMLL